MASLRVDYETLATLVASMFDSSEELLSMIQSNYPQIAQSLPIGGPLVYLVHDLVRILDRKELLNEQFFSILEKRRPKRQAEILQLASLWRSGKEPPRARLDSSHADLLVKVTARAPAGRQYGLILPVSKAGDLPASHWAYVQQMIADALSNWKQNLLIQDGNTINERTFEQLSTDQLFIADLSTPDPNVAFKLGLRMAANKPILVIADNKSQLPFNLTESNYLIYPRDLNPSGVQEFKAHLFRKVEEMAKGDYKSHFIDLLKSKQIATSRPPRAFEIELIEERLANLERMLADRQPTVNTMMQSTADSTSQITILFASASPEFHARIRVDREIGNIVDVLERSSNPFKIIQLQAANFDRLRTALIRHQPHILHITCHGDQDGSIKLEGSQSESEVISKRRLLQLLSSVQGRLNLFLLNSCHSRVVAQDIPPTINTISFSNEIVDDEALKFFTAFYSSLAQNQSVERSFNLGLAQISDDYVEFIHLSPAKADDIDKLRDRNFVS